MRTILASLKEICDSYDIPGNDMYFTRGEVRCYTLYRAGMFWGNVNKDDFEIEYTTDGKTFQKPKSNSWGYVNNNAIIVVTNKRNQNRTNFNSIPLIKSTKSLVYIYGSGNITAKNITEDRWLHYIHFPGPSNKTYQVIFDNSYLTDVKYKCNNSISDDAIYSPIEFSVDCDFYVERGGKDISVKSTCEQNSCFNVKTGIVQNKEYFITEDDNFVEESEKEFATPDYYMGYKIYFIIAVIALGICDTACTICGCYGCYKCCKFKKLMKQKAEASSSSSYSYSSSRYSSYSYSKKKKNKSADLKEV